MLIFAVVISVFCFIAFRYFNAGIVATKSSNQELTRQVNELNEQLDRLTNQEAKSKRDAEVAFEAKDKLLSALSHEIRTPMNGIIGMANLLIETELNTEQKEFANSVLECSTNLLYNVNEILINDMLFSKTDTPDNQIEDINFDVHNCVEEVMDMFSTRAAGKEIELLYHVNEHVPLQIETDYKRLQQILMNLIDNSLNHTDVGEILVTVDARLNEKGDKRIVEFMVSDSGTGIPADKIKNIFKGSVSPDETSNTNGFGLVICKRIVDQLGGEISVVNNENSGCTFSFTLPVSVTHNTSLDFIDNRLRDIEGKQVLIISGNMMTGQIISRQLEKWKLIPVFANNKKDAMDILSQISVDVMFVDVSQAVGDGISLTKEIKAKYDQVPVVLMNSMNDDRYKNYADFFTSVISKPLKYSVILDSLISALRNSSVSGNTIAHLIPADFAVRYPLRIIVAEDNPMNQKWIKKILGKIGYECEIAGDGNAIIDRVSHEKFDMILMDVQMPLMDGLEATRMIRLCLETQPVIVAMTANAMQGDREKCLESGMNDYISKPVELPVLLSMLEKWAIFIRDKKEDSLEKFNA